MPLSTTNTPIKPMWSIDVTLLATTIVGQSGPKNNENEGEHYSPESFRRGSTPSYAVYFDSLEIFIVDVILLLSK